MFADPVFAIDVAAAAVSTAAIQWIKWGVKRGRSGIEDVGSATQDVHGQENDER